MQRKNAGQAGDRIARCRATHASVEDLVVIALCGEIVREKVGIRLAVLQSETGGDAVTKADERALIGGGDGPNQKQEKNE